MEIYYDLNFFFKQLQWLSASNEYTVSVLLLLFCSRFLALRQEDEVFHNAGVIRTNAMKYLPNFFRKGDLGANDYEYSY